MADVFTNDLRIREQESGSNAGTWGGLLNTTIRNIASAFGQGSETIPNASTHTITLADGVADEARSMYLKCTGGGQACTVTLAPNTISKVWIISNETSFTLTFTQGSGANVAVAAGSTKMIVTDGAGSGAAVTDALSGLSANVSDLTTTGDISFGDNDKAIFGAGSDLQIYSDGDSSYLKENSATGSLFVDGDNIRFRTSDGSKSYALFTNSGSARLYHDNSIKIETASTGIDVTGGMTTTGNVGIGRVPRVGLDVAGEVAIAYDANYGLRFYNQSQNNWAFIGNDVTTSAADLRLGDSTGEVMRLKGGNLLVGKTALGVGNYGFAARADTGGSVEMARDGGTVLYVNRGTSDGQLVSLRKDNTEVGSIGSEGGDSLYIQSGTTSGAGLLMHPTAGNINPARSGAKVDNAIDLGRSTHRFKDLYRSGSTISTSDRNMKQDIRDLTDAERNVAVAAKGLLKAFRFIDTVSAEGNDASIHFGIIAQDLADAFTAEGLDADDYQVYRADTFTDDNGNQQTHLGICYENLLAFIIAAI